MLGPMKISFLTTLLLAAFLLIRPASALELSGMPEIFDGDTLRIAGQKIRLHGIDAFENGQDCQRGARHYNCGAAAENALSALAKDGLTCRGDSVDGYDRLIAVCRARGRDINAAMVRAGHALAFRRYSEDYVAQEDDARAARAGAWAGSFITPWEFRAAKWDAASQSAPDPACPIKGNINRKGVRIYHTPWSRSYERTRINVSKGERWFCNEAEAEAAGWRAHYR